MDNKRSCAKCACSFEIVESDFSFYKKLEVPPPTYCPDCREQRRLIFHNERKLYRRSCDFTGENLLSHFSSDKPRKVYKQQIWWGDDWDPLTYGRDFDFSRPFFDQFDELLREVPQVSLFTDYLVDENSEYTNYAGHSKNCYLIAHADFNRDCYYGYGVKKCESCCDIYNAVMCELCYECIDCYSCYGLKFSQDCLNCSNSSFLRDCVACKNCFGCQNLHQKEYWVFNTPYSKSDYETFLRENNLGSYKKLQKIKARFQKWSLTQPHRNLHMLKAENCLGDQIVNCKNVAESFEISDMEDGKYCSQMKLGAKDCMDIHQFGNGAELLYECVISGESSHFLRFCNACITCRDVTYSSHCLNSQNLFGCICLRHKEYCILNKQYSRDEYAVLSKKITAHMYETGEFGEFFPVRLSPFGYNETRAVELFPLTKAEALQQGFLWAEDQKFSDSMISQQLIPDEIAEVKDSIVGLVLECSESGKAFKITEAELKLYRQIGVPVPRRSPDQRYYDRQALKNPRHLWGRSCCRCKKSIVSSYGPEREEKVVCEECYLGLVQ